MSQAFANLGKIDRAIRFGVALTLVAFAVFCPFAASLGVAVQVASAAIGVVLLVTVLRSRCPLYSALGLRTTSG